MRFSHNLIGPCAVLRCNRRKATVGALVLHGDSICALTVAHVFCTGQMRKVTFAGCSGGGWLKIYSPLRRFRVHCNDGALVALDVGTPFGPDHPLIGPLAGYFSEVPCGLPVVFLGTSGISRGYVRMNTWGGRVRYPWGSRRLQDQILIEVLDGSKPRRGDSGSLWVTESGYAVGLQVAMTGRFAIATPLASLLRTWGAQLLRSDSSS